jgi:hypothetical protein
MAYLGTRRALLPVAGPPAIDFDFLPLVPFSRASVATYFDSAGTLQSALANIPRYDYSPVSVAVTNFIRNSTMGGVASPTTQPTYWSGIDGLLTPVNGLSATLSTGVESGVPYLDVRYQGTATSATGMYIRMEQTQQIAATVGQTWALSAYLRRPAVDVGPVATISLFLGERDSTGLNLQFTSVVQLVANQSLIGQRFSSVHPNANAATAFMLPAIQMLFPSAATYDVTVRIGGIQLELSTEAHPWVPTGAAAATQAPFAPKGLMSEPQRTNSIRNPRAEGAVVGTPGTLPTNWVQATATGITPSVIGFGSENGIPYIDLQISGTSTGGANNIQAEANIIAATPSQTWTSSVSLRLVAGSFTNVQQIRLIGGDNIVSQTSTAISFPTSAPLAAQRYSFAWTTNAGAVTTLVYPCGLNIISFAGAVNFTLRIGAPQLELGGFPTSIILPGVGTPAVTTRAAETGTPLDPRIVFTRASSATYFDVAGNPQNAANNIPRFDFDPVTHAPKGLIIEETRTNLLLNSAVLGTQNVTTSVQNYCLSFYGTGTITLTGSINTSLVGAGAFPARASLLFLPSSGTLTLTVSGSVQRANLEAGDFPTSYIPTTGAAATRAVETVKLSGDGWLRQGIGTLVGEYIMPAPIVNRGNAAMIACLDNSISSQNQTVMFSNNLNQTTYQMTTGGSNAFNLLQVAALPNVITRSGYAWGLGSVSAASAGVLGVDLAQKLAVPPLSELIIGAATLGVGFSLNGWIRRLRYWPRKLCRNDLRQLTL